VRDTVNERFGLELSPKCESSGSRVKASDFGKVAVLMGGRSADRAVSLKSGSMILAALRKKASNAHAFDPKERGLDALIEERFDRVFIALARPLWRGRHTPRARSS